MTIEEKAKAYDKALVIARSRYSTETEESVRICLELMFPELKESEDERIRKGLIRVFSNREKYVINQSFGDINVSDILAWLEKQGEQKSVNDLTPQEAMDIAVAKCFEQDEQKPAWSEEDENRLSDAVFFVREYQIPTRDKRLLNAAKEAEEWLKSLKERYTLKPSDESIGMQNEIARLKAKLRDFGCEL